MRKQYLLLAILLIALAAAVFGREQEPPLPPAAGTNVIAIGDSLVYGTGSTPGSDFVSRLSDRLSIPIVNAGIPGDTSADVLERLSRDVLTQHPRVVVVVVGGNDFLRRVAKEDTLQNVRKIVSQAQDAGARVVLVGISRLVYDDEYRMIAQEHGALFVPHVMDRILQRQSLMADRVHPNDQGYKVFADTVEPYLIKALGE